MKETTLLTDPQAIRVKARQIADTLVHQYQTAYTQDDPLLVRFLAEEMSLVLLVFIAPKSLQQFPLTERQRIAREAIQAVVWSTVTRVTPGSPEPSRPAPQTYTLVPSSTPGYYALDTPDGRVLFNGDIVLLQVGKQTWMPATIRDSSQQLDGQGCYVLSSLVTTQANQGPVAITKAGALIGLCTGMRVRLEQWRPAKD